MEDSGMCGLKAKFRCEVADPPSIPPPGPGGPVPGPKAGGLWAEGQYGIRPIGVSAQDQFAVWTYDDWF